MKNNYTDQDLEDFYFKIFLKYGISSLSDLDNAIAKGILNPDELVIKMEDLISKDELQNIMDKVKQKESESTQTSQPNSDTDNRSISTLY